MMSSLTAQARVIGIVRGREIDTPASVTIEPDTLVLTWQGAIPWRLSFAGIEGMAGGVASLTLYLENNDVLELHGDEQLRPLGLHLLDQACAMPELTRGLKSLGSSRGTPVEAHDRWFAPLLAARRSVEGVSDPMRQVMLLEASALALEIERAIGEIAASRAPGDARERRAVEAALEEEAEAVFIAIAGMKLAGDALGGGALDTRMVDWRRWVEAVRGVFRAVDDAWPGIATELR